MDRRAFITASAGAAAFCWAAPWLDCYGVLIDRMQPEHPSLPTLIVVDSALAESRAFAANACGSGVHRIDMGIDIDADVGTLWHAKLRHWTGAICGMLRPSDCFVLRTFSMAEGRVFRVMPVLVRPGRQISEARAAAFALDGAFAAPSSAVCFGTCAKPLG